MPVTLIVALMFMLFPFTNQAVAQTTSDTQDNPIQVVSAGQKVHIALGETIEEAYSLNPFSPLLFSVQGPGTLTVLLYKNYSNDNLAAAQQPATFQIYKNDSLFKTINHPAKSVVGQTYKEIKDLLPGEAYELKLEIPEEKWKVGILLTPDSGAASVSFEPPAAPEEAMLPLVPLVPLVPIAPEPVKEEPPVEEKPAAVAEEPKEEPKEEPAPEEPKEDDTIYVSLEPRLGVNLAIQTLKSQEPTTGGIIQKTEYQTDAMFTLGFSAKYVMPWMDQRFRLGIGFDWYQFSYNKFTTAPVYIKLMSVPIMVEFDAFILTDGIFRPFVGVGAGINYAKLTYVGPSDLVPTGYAEILDPQITYAVALWAGCQFHVWQGGPFVKARYMFSQYDHPQLKQAEHGGLSFLVGYQFEF